MTISFLAVAIMSTAQIHGDFSKIVNRHNINKVISVNDDNEYAEYIYLGKIALDSNKFDVIRETRNNKLLPSIHGFSRLLFLDFQQKTEFEYELYYDYELPYRLSGHTLYFHYFDDKTAKQLSYSFEIKNKLPKILNVSPGSTTERFNPNKAVNDQD